MKIFPLMCEKAINIQKYWKPISGDFIFPKHDKDNPFNQDNFYDHVEEICKKPLRFNISNHDPNWDFKKKDVIWLPTIEQFKEMFEPISLGEIVQRFYDYFKEWEMKCSVEEYTTYSMKQIWLCFVMKELYNKMWTGKDWAEILKEKGGKS